MSATLPASTIDELAYRAEARQVARSRSGTFILIVITAALTGLGMLFGAAAVMWPDVLEAFGVSKGVYGTFSGVGIILAFPVLLAAGWLTHRFDKRSLVAASLLFLVLFCGGLAAGWTGVVTFGLLMLVRGVGITLVDLSVNALAMDYEWAADRHIMSPLHAGFSAGNIIGALVVSAVFSLGGDFRSAYATLAVFFLVLAVAAVVMRMGPPLPTAPADPAASKLQLGLARRGDIRLYAIICALCFGGEALVAEWLALFLKEDRGLEGRWAVLSISAFGVAMLAGRIGNGPFTMKVGPRRATALQGVLVFAGGVLMVAGGPGWLAVAGTALAGLGFSGMAPMALSLAGAAVPAATGAAAGLALTGGYLGSALAPFMGGLVSTAFSVRATMFGVAISGLAVALLASRYPEKMPGNGLH